MSFDEIANIGFWIVVPVGAALLPTLVRRSLLAITVLVLGYFWRGGAHEWMFVIILLIAAAVGVIGREIVDLAGKAFRKRNMRHV